MVHYHSTGEIFTKETPIMKNKNIQIYSPEEYRGFINFLLDRIDDVKILRRILTIVNEIFCKL